MANVLGLKQYSRCYCILLWPKALKRWILIMFSNFYFTIMKVITVEALLVSYLMSLSVDETLIYLSELLSLQSNYIYEDSILKYERL